MVLCEIREYLLIILILLTILWTVSSLTRSASYQQIAVTAADGPKPMMMVGNYSSVSLHQCAAKCDRHQNCTGVLYMDANRACRLYAVEYPRTPYPIDVPPPPTSRAFLLKSGCQYSYSRFINKCFTLQNFLAPKSNHTKTCNKSGGRLIQFSSTIEVEFFRGLLRFINGNNSAAYFIGADLQNIYTKTFVWTNTTKTVDASYLWGAGQPDGLPGPNENCVETTTQFDYKLNDVWCEVNKSAICEFPFNIL